MRNLLAKNAILAVILMAATSAYATDGMNPISFDARSAAMGGANTALAGSPLSAMTSNPATMTLSGHAIDFNTTLLIPYLTLNDGVMTPGGAMPLNTDKKSADQLFPLFGIAYSAPVYKGLYLGMGIYVQGGMGSNFKNVNTMVDPDPTTATDDSAAVGSRYDMKSQIMYVKFAPSIAYKYKDFSIGASFHIGMAKMDWKHYGMQFPEMDGDNLFSATKAKFDGDFAFGFGGRIGFLFNLIDDQLTFGASYMTKASPKFEGKLTLMDQMEYDASTEDFSWAQEAALGIAGKLFKKRLILSADFRWINWSDAVQTVTFNATAKDATMVPQGYETLALPFQMNWQDSIVVALGAEYAFIEDFFFGRVGYNYGREPATPSGLNPLFPPVNAHHITAGLGFKHLWKGLNLNVAFEYALPGQVESDEKNQMAVQPGTTNPNGYYFDVEMQQVSLYVGLGWDFN